MKTVTFTKRLPIVVGLLIAISILPKNVNSQVQIKDSSVTNLVTYYSVREYSSYIPELQNTISLQLKDFPLTEALFHIAQEANLEIAFDPGLFDEAESVTIQRQNIRVADALAHALQNTGYESVITQNKEILLKKKEAAPQEDEFFEIELEGQVTDIDSGEPLVGVTVFLMGTNTGTTTDEDGRFTLTVPDDAETLAFSYVGYERQEIPIAGQTDFDIELSTDVAMLDDVVVVGYGTQQRTEVTGSVVSIRAEEIRDVPVTSFENALQGRLAGVNVTEPSGEPGAAPQITIRGVGSISAGNVPLYVIDGVPFSLNFDQQEAIASQNSSFAEAKTNPLASLNPNDIESIEILKDASAAAIYGSRGSNGVILITTRKGKAGAPRVNFRSYGVAQTVFHMPEMMNAEELIDYTIDARNNTYEWQSDPQNPNSPQYNPLYDPNTNAGREETGATGNALIPEEYVNWDGTDTDWLGLIFDPGYTQNYDISVSGGSDRFTYLISTGYMDQKGTIKGSEFERYSVNANLTTDFTDELQVGLQINTSFNNHDRIAANGPYFGNPPGVIYSAWVQSPVAKPFQDDGVTYRQIGIGSQNELGGGTTTSNHPLAVRDYIDDTIKENRVFGNVYASYDILENLEFKSLLGYDVYNRRRHFYQGTQLNYRGGDPRPYAQSAFAQSFNWLWENTLSYNAQFGSDHKLGVIAGYTAQKQEDERNFITASNFPDDQVKTINGGQISGGDQTIEEWSLVSALARLNYVFKDRYLLTATIRSDRSSRFGLDKQTGYFPSISLGWTVTNEPFMENVELFSLLKPRVSYGATGNFSIGNYASIGLISSSNYTFGNQVVSGVAPATLSNKDLTWESTKQMNFGIDYALLQDRIYGSFDYYVSNTSDLLLSVNIPSQTGFTNALTNIGEVENKGFEVQLTSRNVVGRFNWATDFNFATNQNEVKKLGPEGDPILISGAAGLRHITQIGSPIGSYYGYNILGIFQNQAEIDAAPVDLVGDPTPGDYQFEDVNGDGFIDPDDRTVIGDYYPDFTWGITNRFNYRNFDFSFFFQGVVGRDIMNLTFRHMGSGGNFSMYAALNDRWISESNPGSGKYPKAARVSSGQNERESTHVIQDGSYVKLKNITMGYNLPTEIATKFARSARIFASVTNVAIWTDYLGFNPEVNLQGGITPGEDYGAYPLSRSYQIGIDISF